MKRLLVVFLIFFSVPLHAGHTSSKPGDTKSSLIKTVVELLNSRSKRDTVKKRKNDRKKKKSRKYRKKKSH